ncbi:hypothetical protein QFC21_004143 [Naganishia friedmannii]|uniref:Uncharacterized protein n=1 Tax=Naganishia friedmannii TaxID=89922 RepID=A0ACC2VIZ9_9TREE|nr:hypothetical protein QFC21_004143 [Naganishia friedmannii]
MSKKIAGAMSKLTGSSSTTAPRPINHTSASSNNIPAYIPPPSPPSTGPPSAVNVVGGVSSGNSAPGTSMQTATSVSVSNASSSMVNPSIATEEEEDLEDYRPGGYHPIHIGDDFNNGRYTIVRKLGWGHFSTVWLARDNTINRHVALKVVKSDNHYTETALDEIQLLNKLRTSSLNHPGRDHTVQLLDDFRHEGENGSHVCMVFEVLGENLLGLIKRYQHRGVPQHIVKQITKQVLMGLDYLHTECGIIHTDLKPENVLICIDDVEAVVAAELASCPAAVPTKILGVPPSEGRGGTQTPRREGIFITGSQPLPSPSSSYGASPMMDKYGFGMSKISQGTTSLSKSFGAPSPANNNNGNGAAQKEGSAGKSTEGIKDGLGNVTIKDASDPLFGEKTKTAVPTTKGPSLLSQQLHNPGKKPAMNTTGSAGPSADTTPSPHDRVPTIANKGGSSSGTPNGIDQNRNTTDKPSRPSLDAAENDPHHGHTHSADEVPQTSVMVNDPTTLPPPAPYDPQSLEMIRVKVCDMGNACWVDHHFTNDIQTRQYRAPEILIGAKWNERVDNWSMACLTFELLTGDYLFDPQASSKYSKDDDHLAQILELLGDMPRPIALSGKYSSELFNRRGQLRNIAKLRYWGLRDVLSDKYLLDPEEAEKLAGFLLPMLKYDITERATAREMLDHEWLKGVYIPADFDP